MPRQLSISELESFPSLDWFDVAPRVAPAVRSSVERILETQNGNCHFAGRGLRAGSRRRRRSARPARRRQPAARRTLRQPRHLRGESQHQLHQHLFCGMQVLRLQPRPARVRHIFPRARSSRAKGRRGLATRRDRSLHPGRTAARPASVLLSRHSARGEERRARNAHPRLLADGNRLRRRTHRHAARRLSLDAARQRPGHAARHRRRNSRRRSPPHSFGQQTLHRAVDRSHPHRSSRWHPLHFDHDVWTHRNARALGPPDALAARDSERNRRLHRIRPARLRAPEHAAVSSGTRALRAHAGRASEGARSVAPAARRLHQQHSGFMGKVESPSLATLPARRRQRLWRHADGRKYFARSRSHRRPVHQPGRFSVADSGDGPRPRRAQHHSTRASNSNCRWKSSLPKKRLEPEFA